MNGSSGTPAFDRIDFVFYSTNDNVNVAYSDTLDYSGLYSWQDHKFVLTTVFLDPVTNATSKATNPFPAHPPAYVRALLYDYKMADLATHRRTGAWWVRTRVGTYFSACALRPSTL